jgi:hypothetical protein
MKKCCHYTRNALKKDPASAEYLNFYITSSNLFVSLDRCSVHYNRNLDEIGDFEFVFKLKDWDVHLTSYAKNLAHP